jgi:hypothetical protein
MQVNLPIHVACLAYSVRLVKKLTVTKIRDMAVTHIPFCQNLEFLAILKTLRLCAFARKKSELGELSKVPQCKEWLAQSRRDAKEDGMYGGLVDS